MHHTRDIVEPLREAQQKHGLAAANAALIGLFVEPMLPTPVQLKQAIQRVLHDASYRQHARAIQADFAARDSPTEAAQLLERLVQTKQPIVRTNIKL